ncbi:LysR family transcriptional regulator [Pseudomonas sp. HR96]|uniref:LysR family transcriptional regulator n=1 Tax=Pseudomonas sp. HR96 TaxID=1027966 RepID=UPI002A75C81C|nr:LysR family transcriptional regulator [Pseudomonas sp. HR96]WPO99776.1 LysR family transcriptional regulator [Pseudomonas sp. HR96]
MNQLNAMRAFRCIVEAGGFTAAAQRLETNHSTVSRQLQQLEALLAVQLVQRNTRRLSLTAAGEQYYQVCVEVLERLDGASQALQSAASQVRGPLRVSVPLSIGTLELGNWLPAWRQAFPEVQLYLSSDDRFVDVVAESFDVALRISEPLVDSGLKARLLTRSEMVLVASAAYVQRRGLPRIPLELAGHELLSFATSGSWPLRDRDGKLHPVKLGAGLRSDTITVLYAAALAGSGIAAFTHTTVAADLQAGRLVRILPDCSLGERHYYALYSQTRHLPAQARAFIDFMAHHYAD